MIKYSAYNDNFNASEYMQKVNRITVFLLMETALLLAIGVYYVS